MSGENFWNSGKVFAVKLRNNRTYIKTENTLYNYNNSKTPTIKATKNNYHKTNLFKSKICSQFDIIFYKEISVSSVFDLVGFKL